MLDLLHCYDILVWDTEIKWATIDTVLYEGPIFNCGPGFVLMILRFSALSITASGVTVVLTYFTYSHSFLFCCVQFASREVYLTLFSTLLFFVLLLQITSFNCKTCGARQLLIIWLCALNWVILKPNKYIFCWILKHNHYLIISRCWNLPLQTQRLSSCFLLFPPLENRRC